jgi:hypothetical protein
MRPQCATKHSNPIGDSSTKNCCAAQYTVKQAKLYCPTIITKTMGIHTRQQLLLLLLATSRPTHKMA